MNTALDQYVRDASESLIRVQKYLLAKANMVIVKVESDHLTFLNLEDVPDWTQGTIKEAKQHNIALRNVIDLGYKGHHLIMLDFSPYGSRRRIIVIFNKQTKKVITSFNSTKLEWSYKDSYLNKIKAKFHNYETRNQFLDYIIVATINRVDSETSH